MFPNLLTCEGGMVFYALKNLHLGVPWWLIRLRIQLCYCYDSSHSFNPCPRNFRMPGHGQKKKKKKACILFSFNHLLELSALCLLPFVLNGQGSRFLSTFWGHSSSTLHLVGYHYSGVPSEPTDGFFEWTSNSFPTLPDTDREKRFLAFGFFSFVPVPPAWWPWTLKCGSRYLWPLRFWLHFKSKRKKAGWLHESPFWGRPQKVHRLLLILSFLRGHLFTGLK